MISRENMLYSLRNIWQRKSRSALTVLSMFVGIVSIFIFISFGLGLQNYVNDLASGGAADKLIVQAKGIGLVGLDSAFKLEESDVEAIEKTFGITDATGSYFKAAPMKQGKITKYSLLIGTDMKKPLIWEIADIGIEKGRQLNDGEKGKVVMGYNYLIPDKIFPKAFDVGDKIEVDGIDMRIVGFVESVGNPQDDSQVYITNEYMESLYPDITYGWIMARAPIDQMNAMVESVKKSLRKNRDQEEGKEDFFVQSFQSQIESFGSALDIIVGFIVLIALISVIVSAINTANTMVTSVLERFKEIGIIKSIGARNSEIFNIFLFESSFLGLIAGVLGVLVGWMISAATGSVLVELGWGFLQPAFTTSLFLGLIAFAVITGAVSGVAPAIQASRLKPVDALRYE